MPRIPGVAQRLFMRGMVPMYRGKVRDTYALKDKLLPVATDRISIFDFVLPAEVPGKGEILTAMNIFWANQLDVPQDIVAFGQDIDSYLPEPLRGNGDIQKRTVVVKRLKMIPVEAIVRGYLTGSGWKSYKESQQVCGHKLHEGLTDGDYLPQSIFTPTTKAAEGHDEHMTYMDVREQFGNSIEELSLRLYSDVGRVAMKRGVILADTKLEFGLNHSCNLVLGDERFTPDSSRFWLLADWERSRKSGGSPTSFDKQYVRDWGKSFGMDDSKKFNPLNPDHIAEVEKLMVPADVLRKTAQLYRYIFWMLTGKRLEVFQREDMGVNNASFPLRPVEVLLGSQSDLPQAEGGLAVLDLWSVPYRVHIVSCHRNPEALRKYIHDEDAVDEKIPENAVIIAAAGKAAALPGIVASWLRFNNKDNPVIGVALKGSTPEADAAARLSIEELPEKPVICGPDGKAYFGPEGFIAACTEAVTSEFHVPPMTLREPVFALRSRR